LEDNKNIMAKRKSFEEKNNYIHPTRKKIIDTVFGRDDNQTTFGYEGEVETKKEVGEIWTDKEGKKWEQKEGYKISVSQLDDVRAYLEKLNTCSAEDCNTIQYGHADKKLIRKTGYCSNCLAKMETQLRIDGTFPFYADYKITRNQIAYVRDLKMRFEDALAGLSKTLEFVNEDGRIEKWNYDVDMDKVKADLQKDIDGATEAIEALLERKAALEEKLCELNHSELIKK
jgi:hypothetical protein